ncbi:MAG: hypothetical protein ACR2KJ_11060 [Jatrophihabitans sp.]
MANPELRTLHRLVDDLQREITSLVARYGEAPAVRRINNDVERLRIDMDDLASLRAPRANAAAPEIRAFADQPIDPAAWADSDDEGLGGYHGGSR